MRALLPIAALALALSACSGPCDELAARLCECPATGVSSSQRIMPGFFTRSVPDETWRRPKPE